MSPQQMHAAVLHGLGATPRYEPFPAPMAGPDEVVIEVAAAALKPSDRLMAEGVGYAPTAFPHVAGSTVSAACAHEFVSGPVERNRRVGPLRDEPVEHTAIAPGDDHPRARVQRELRGDPAGRPRRAQHEHGLPGAGLALPDDRLPGPAEAAIAALARQAPEVVGNQVVGTGGPTAPGWRS